MLSRKRLSSPTTAPVITRDAGRAHLGGQLGERGVERLVRAQGGGVPGRAQQRVPAAHQVQVAVDHACRPGERPATVVVSRPAGPSRSSTAVAVSSFTLEAGMSGSTGL